MKRALSNGVRIPLPSSPNSVPPSPPSQDTRKLVVVLDIDETLIHSHPGLQHCDDSFMINVDGWKTRVKRRPHVRWFLETAASKYELMTFTAGTEGYASKILDDLDPTGELIKHRFYRHHCLKIDDETYLKELQLLNRPLDRIVLVDNNLLSFVTNPSNGIPIESFYGREPHDVALIALMTVLDALCDEPDVRPLLQRAYRLGEQLQHEQKALQAAITKAQTPKL
ncbi:hypothetical protein BASA81_003478 [Batrachochytrium salamandrivorans]|nr:hypothetical protein BASA81_003478 [Batrachochytrium salamandrivorans]